MSANPTCTAAIHAALTASPEFARLRLIGYQQLPASATEPADIIELRRCGCCDSTLGRGLGIGARLAVAQRRDDVAMIARCRRALAGDERAVRSYVDAVEMERLMGGVR